MILSDLSIKRPIMMTMFLMVFVLFGGIAYFSLDLNLMPDIEVPYVTVQTVYPGAGPKELESEVTKKIEDAVSTISQIKTLVSYSLEGVSIVQIEFELDKDVDIANQEVKDKVDAILNDLPADAEIPIIQKIEIGSAPVVDLVLSGNMTPVVLYELADKNLKDRFSQINGVASVDIVGGQEREIKVELDNRIVYQNSISLMQLSQILAAENVDIPGGNFKRSSQEYTARLKGKYSSVEALRNLEINTGAGKKKLGKIASVADAGEEVRIRSTFFQKLTKSKEHNVVILSVIKAKDGNTVELAKEVQNILPELKKELPDGVSLEVVTDKSQFIEASVEDTLSNIGLGIILTAVVLLFFLHDLRSTIIAALSMPFSIISTFMLLDFFGYSLNVMTLMGLSTSVGILVANSIVVLENIFRHKEMGHKKKDAAGRGTSEVVIAVIASAMTNIVVFLPLANMSSLVGSIFKEFALTVTFATIFSIIVSFTLTPMLASIILPDKDTKKHKIGAWLENIFKSWELSYQKVLRVIVKNRLSGGVTVLIAVAMFFASLFAAGKLSFEFMPLMDEGLISIEVELPQGYNLEQTANLLEEAEKRIVRHDEIKNILTQIGKINNLNQGTNLALIKIQLDDADERDISTNEMVTILIRDMSDIPNAMFRISAASSNAAGSMAPVELYLQGIDLEKLEYYKSEITSSLKTIDGLTNLNTSSRAGKPEITLVPDRVKLADAGLTAYDLAMTLRAGMEGLTTTKFSDGGEEYDIRVSLTDESVDSPEKISNMTVISPKGKFTMNQLAEIDFTEGYSRILHRDKAKTIQITGSIADGFALGDIVNEVEKRLTEIEFENGYSIQWAGTAEMMNEVILDMGFAFILALILTYMLLAAILESFTQPLLILATIPMALIGVFLALYIFGISVSVFAMLAIVMLIGIVVNNAILLLDYTNVLVKRGLSVKDALIEACPTKLKPVLMSTIAIILGMLPMALGIGSAGKEFRQPIGVVSIGGLIVSGVITLFVIPALYELTHSSKKQAEGDSNE